MAYTPSDDIKPCPEFNEWYAKHPEFHELPSATLGLMRKAFMVGMSFLTVNMAAPAPPDPQEIRELTKSIERAIFQELTKFQPRAARIERMLAEHHAWHQEPKTLCARNAKGELMEWCAAEAYVESKLCDDTINALKK